MITRAAHLKALADKDAIETAIRDEADPGDLYSRGTIDTAGLVKNIRKRHRDCIETPDKKQNEMQIEEEDLQNEFNDEKEREIRDLKIIARTDGETLKQTNDLLSESRTALSRAESKIRNHHREAKVLEKFGEAWKKAYETKNDENMALRSEMRKLKQDQSTELILAQAENENLQVWIERLKADNDKMDEELESREHEHHDSQRTPQTEQINSLSRDDVRRSLTEALKAAKSRANTLQISLNAMEAEKGVLERRLGDVVHSYIPQVLEQLDRLQSENHILREAKEAAATKMTELIGQLAKTEQEQEERFADRARKLEAGFLQGFDDLRNIRDQWLLHKRSLEQQHNRDIVAENLRRETEYRRQEDQLTAAWKVKWEELQGKEEGLQIRERELANQASNLASGDQNLFEMTARAEKAEKELIDLQVAARNDSARRELIEKNLNNEVQNQRRAAQRLLDLLNEETSKMPEWSRIIDLHNELQQANCSMNNFVFNVTYNETNSEALSQMLFGAEFDDHDVSLLQGERRPGLLAQLRGAKQTLNTLRRLLAQSPKVEVDRALSVVMAARGGEGIAQPADDFFDQWYGNGQSAPQPNPRKRSAPPSGGPTYGDHEDNATTNDWGDQEEASSGARLSTPDEVRTRRRILPKSRRNGGPANLVSLESTDPAIRRQ